MIFYHYQIIIKFFFKKYKVIYPELNLHPSKKNQLYDKHSILIYTKHTAC